MSETNIPESPERAARGSSSATLLEDPAGHVLVMLCKFFALGFAWQVDIKLVIAWALWRLSILCGEAITERQKERSSNAGTQRPGSPDGSLATETRKPGSLK
jgi:hypothetical protein